MTWVWLVIAASCAWVIFSVVRLIELESELRRLEDALDRRDAKTHTESDGDT